MEYDDHRLCLPTYVLTPLPMEVCALVASFLHHPHTVLKNYLAIQRQFIITRMEETYDQLEKRAASSGPAWFGSELEADDHRLTGEITMQAVYVLRRIIRKLERRGARDHVCGVVATRMTHRLRVPHRVARDVHFSTTPVYLRELKLWFEHGWESVTRI